MASRLGRNPSRGLVRLLLAVLLLLMGQGALGAGQRDSTPAAAMTPLFVVAAEAESVLVQGAGRGTRAINFRPNAADPKWGLTRAHLDKHLFGSGSKSLSSIDPAGNSDIWFGYMQELASRPATATLKNGVEDIICTFPRTGGGGTFRFGIRIAPGEGGAFDLVTLLTKQ